MNDDLLAKETLLFRHQSMRALRAYFDDDGFVEIETPYLIKSNPPDPFIDPFLVKSQQNDATYQLHTSPELWLKRALSLGLPKIYEIARVFRDDQCGVDHHTEFTMLEWYRVGSALDELIQDCQNIFRIIADTAHASKLMKSSAQLRWEIVELDLLFKEQAGLDLAHILHQISIGKRSFFQELLTIEKGEHLPKNASFCDAFTHVMTKYIEPSLPRDRVVVIKRWPLQLAALAAESQDDANYCDRFEIYYQGKEIANAYQECTEPEVLARRFERENQEREMLGKPGFCFNFNELSGISQFPKTAGIALGVDRLLIAILNKRSLQEIIFGANDR